MLARLGTLKRSGSGFRLCGRLCRPTIACYDHRRAYAWLAGVYITFRRQSKREPFTSRDPPAKTREMIRAHTEILDIADNVPIYKIDADYLVKVMALPTPADRAAEMEAALNAELLDGGSFLYKKLGERLKAALARKEADDEAAAKLLEELSSIVGQVQASQAEPARLGLEQPGEFELFTVVREFAKDADEARCADATRFLMGKLREKGALPSDWADSVGGYLEGTRTCASICTPRAGTPTCPLSTCALLAMPTRHS